MGAAYRWRVGELDSSTTLEELGHLIAAGAAGGFQSHFHKQTDAWQVEIEAIGTLVDYLKHFVAGSGDWWLLFEYDIPRREARPDVVLLAHDVIFVLEFKVGAEDFTAADACPTCKGWRSAGEAFARSGRAAG